jgi:hypothetical protein
MHRKFAIGVATAALLTGVSVAAAAAPASGSTTQPAAVHLRLTPSSAQLAGCMPHAKVNVTVELKTASTGRDVFRIKAEDLPPNRDFTVFLLEQAGAPFGAAEYIGDLSTDRHGDGSNTFKLIVQEAFASTLVNGQRTRVDLNRVGMWFADPKDDDFCLGPNSPVTPFDGDNQAGVQAFNSINADPLPLP